MPAIQRAAARPIRWAMCTLAAAAIAVAACGTVRAPSATPPLASAAPETPTATASASGSGPSPSAEAAFIDAWAAVAEDHDARAIELLISNPVSEYDLVGTRLIELIEETRDGLSMLDPLSLLRGEVLQLDGAIASTLAMLRDIEPHGPRTERTEAFQKALDDWADHVRPQAEAIREALGLPPVPQGDLQL